MKNRKPITTIERIRKLNVTIRDYQEAKGEYLKFIPDLQEQLNKLKKEQ